MIKLVKTFVANNRNQRMIEYVMITSLVTAFIILILPVLGAKLSSEFIELGNALN